MLIFGGAYFHLTPAARGAAVHDPIHQLLVHVLHVCRVLLISAPFMHCVHNHSAEGFAL